MKLARLLSASLGVWLAACGVSKEEHDRAIGVSLTTQRMVYDNEMRKVQHEYDSELADQRERARKLEDDLQRLGVDLTRERSQLSIQLANTEAELERVRRDRERAERDALSFRTVAERLSSMIDAGQLEVTTRNGRMALKLPDAILFPAGSRKLKKEGRDTMLTVIAALRDVGDREFLIAGHTDSMPVKSGSGFKSNWELSTARALEVVELMVANGVSADRVAAAGFGEHDPIADNSTVEGREQNRRLEIVLMPHIEEIPQQGQILSRSASR